MGLVPLVMALVAWVRALAELVHSLLDLQMTGGMNPIDLHQKPIGVWDRLLTHKSCHLSQALLHHLPTLFIAATKHLHSPPTCLSCIAGGPHRISLYKNIKPHHVIQALDRTDRENILAFKGWH